MPPLRAWHDAPLPAAAAGVAAGAARAAASAAGSTPVEVAAAATMAAASDLTLPYLTLPYLIAERHFCRTLRTAAELAGAKRKRLARGVRAGRGEHDAPFYDAECQAAKSQLRRLIRSRPHRGADCARAESQYHSLVRRKKRAWQRQQLHELLDQLYREPRCFWQRVNRQLTSMPRQMQDPAAGGADRPSQDAEWASQRQFRILF